jgi:polyferredoxin
MDITSKPVLSWLIRQPHILTAIRLLVLCLFVVTLIFGWYYPDTKGAFTTALFWGFFWPFLIVILIPVLGNWFCSICPHGFIGKYITRFGLQKRFPRKLRTTYIGLALLLLCYWLVTFTFPRLMSSSPQLTAGFFLFFTLLAVVCFFVYRGMSYCKYLCPLGGTLAAFGKMGASRISTDSKACASCKSFECAKSCPYQLSPFLFSDRNDMAQCTLCLDCVYSCDSVQLHLQPPMQGIATEIKKTPISEAWILIILTAVVGLGVQFQHGLNHSALKEFMPWNQLALFVQPHFSILSQSQWNGFFALLLALLISISATVVGCRAAANKLQQPFNNVVAAVSYGYAPLVLVALMSHAIPFFLTYSSAVIANSAIDALNLPWLPVEPLVARGAPWLQVFTFAPLAAIACCLVVLYLRCGLLTEQASVRRYCTLSTAAPIWIFLAAYLCRFVA